MTTPAKIKEADMRRAIRAAQKYGATRVAVSPDGTVIFDIVKHGDYMSPDETSPPEIDGPIKVREHAKRKVRLF